MNDGNGFVFVDHVGNICPSGFLPMVRGNVRDGALVDVYRNDSVFRQLRDPGALGGRCGRCRLRAVCGGSRSGAFSATGDPFASDPLCLYENESVEDLISNESRVARTGFITQAGGREPSAAHATRGAGHRLGRRWYTLAQVERGASPRRAQGRQLRMPPLTRPVFSVTLGACPRSALPGR